MPEPTAIEEKIIQRRVTPLERFFRNSPYALVTMVARIRGNVSENDLREALTRVQRRHTNLRVRIREDQDRQPWFTSDGVEDLYLEIVPRESDDHWIGVVQESCRVPFEFDTQPAIRFILLQSPTKSDLVILCHHIICDGMSLAYLARDIMVCLGDPSQEVEVLPDPHPIELTSLPGDVSANAVTRFFINRINKKWEQDRILFDLEDYREINAAYWKRYPHQVLPVELSEIQTNALVDRCRVEGVTVNTALSAAFVGAQTCVLGKTPFISNMAVAGNLRNRLQPPVGDVMGFYAGMVPLKSKFNQKLGFWENARRLHKKLKPLFTNKNLFKDLLPWCYLNPEILESIQYKMLGGLVSPDAPSGKKIEDFSKREDVILSILKRDRMDTLDRPYMGTGITNLTRMEFPTKYGELELDRLIMKPGGGFPLTSVFMTLGAVTSAGKLSLVIEFVEDNIEIKTMGEIIDKALFFLFGD